MTRQFNKLNFFYATTGSFAKLQKMQQVAGSQNDPALAFNTSLYTGDIGARVKTLTESGQLPLAYMTAKSHGLHALAEELEEQISENPDYDAIAIIDEAQKYAGRSKSLIPLRPISLVDQESYKI